MRRANGAEVLKSNDGTIYAINLGADFCAEHEWGVERLRREMGIASDEPRTGFNYHTAKVAPGDKFISFIGKGHQFIVLDGMFSFYKNDEKRLKDLKADYSKGTRELGFITWRGDKQPKILSTAWDEKSFGIVIGKDADKDLKEFGKKLINAIEAGDYAVWFGGNAKGNPFARSGMVVGITSLVPQDVKDYMTAAYKEQARLEAADAATGIKKLLEEKGKKYYACSPKFDADGVSIKYWLNPQEQQKHNYGWFTADELRAWADEVVGNKIDMVKK